MVTRIAVPFVALLFAFLLGCPSGSHSGHEGHDHGASPSVGASPATSPPSAATVAETKVGSVARDPVCGKTVTVEGAPASVYTGTRFHFCSAECQSTFDKSPETAASGLPGKPCICTTGGMANCDCGHCSGAPERCTCGDPQAEEAAGSGHDDHEGHGH